MREMMLALTDQEGGVGMNESPDRLGQAVLRRLPCSSFKRQHTSRYILRSRPLAFVFRELQNADSARIIAIAFDFLHGTNHRSKKNRLLNFICQARVNTIVQLYGFNQKNIRRAITVVSETVIRCRTTDKINLSLYLIYN